MRGYSSYFYENEKGTEISALQNFYLSIYDLVENYNDRNKSRSDTKVERESYYCQRDLKKYIAIELLSPLRKAINCH